MRSIAKPVVIAVLLLLPVAVRANPCAAADDLLKARRYADAEQAYAARLKIDPAEPCSREGIEKIATTRADIARHLELAKNFGSVDKQRAQAEKLAALALDPQALPTTASAAAVKPADPFAEALVLYRLKLYDQALQALQATAKKYPAREIPVELRPLVDPFAPALGLSRAGMHGEALTQLTEAAKKPPVKEIPAELSYLTLPRWLNVIVLHPVNTALVLILVALLAPLLLRHFVLYPHLRVENLTGDTAFPGAGASLYLQQQLVALTRLQPSNVQFPSATLTSFEVPAAITSAIPSVFGWLKGLLSLLSLIYWRRTLILTGCTHPAIDEKGAGLTLVLSERNKVASTTTLWQRDFGTKPPEAPKKAPEPLDLTIAPAPADTAPYLDLLDSAAVWLLYQLLQLEIRHPVRIRAMTGTASWVSDAMNKAAESVMGSDNKRAQELLVGALLNDPEHAAARANFGAMLHDAQLLGPAIEQFEVAKNRMPHSDGPAAPVLFAASYRLAYIHYQRGDIGKALAEADTLLKAMEKADAGAIHRTEADCRRIKTYISYARPPVDVMRIGIAAEVGTIGPHDAYLALLGYRHGPNADTQFNVASTFGVLAAKTTIPVDRTLYLTLGWQHLELALHLQPAAYQVAATDSTLTSLRRWKPKEFENLLAKAKSAVESPAPPPAAPPPPAPLPATPQPVVVRPVVVRPVIAHPVVAQPVVAQPIVVQPMVVQPVVVQPDASGTQSLVSTAPVGTG
ncbi:MAG TPA: hypothetical protein VF432_30935 [Thermoanaerobaculia bacterium]